MEGNSNYSLVQTGDRKLKTIVWNVAGGLAKKLRSSFFQDILNAYDIIIFVETHLDESESLDAIKSMSLFSVVRSDRTVAHAPSGGVLVLVRKDVGVEWDFQIFKDAGIVTLDIPARQFEGIAKPVVVVACYVVPQTSTRVAVWARNERLRGLQAIEDIIASSVGWKEVLILGDPNARVGNRTEWVPNEIDGSSCRETRKENGNHWLRDINPDSCLNDNGRVYLDLCRSFGLLIANGRSIPAEFTRFGPTAASVPDVWLGTEAVLRSLGDGRVHEINTFSDHVPISFFYGGCSAGGQLR